MSSENLLPHTPTVSKASVDPQTRCAKGRLSSMQADTPPTDHGKPLHPALVLHDANTPLGQDPVPPTRVSPQPSPGPRQTATKFWNLLPTRACISQARVPSPVVGVSPATSLTRLGFTQPFFLSLGWHSKAGATDVSRLAGGFGTSSQSIVRSCSCPLPSVISSLG